MNKSSEDKVLAYCLLIIAWVTGGVILEAITDLHPAFWSIYGAMYGAGLIIVYLWEPDHD